MSSYTPDEEVAYHDGSLIAAGDEEGGLDMLQDMNSLARHNAELQAQIKSLEVELSQKESEVRRATEENALRRELQTIQQMTLRKQSDNDGTLQGRMRIDSESLARVIALEDQIKLDSKLTEEGKVKANLIASRLHDVELNILAKSQKVALVKETTGWERDYCAARGYTNPVNKHREHKRITSELEVKQGTLRSVLDKLNVKLEYFAMELEKRKTVDDDFAEAQMMLKQKFMDYDKLVDDKKSLERLLYKKDKLLRETEAKDDYKEIKMIEGEKRVLQTDLARQHDQILTNSKGILAQEVRLRQLEMRLLAINQYLQQTLQLTEDDVLPEGVVNADGTPLTTEVPVELFDGIQRELAISRHTVIQRDAQLEAQDAKVEQLEKKVNILHCAIVTRTAAAAQEAKDMDKEYNVISVHLEYMRSEFEQEHGKLLAENEMLRSRLQAVHQYQGIADYVDDEPATA